MSITEGKARSRIHTGPLWFLAARLQPGDDLRVGLMNLVNTTGAQAVCVISAVGSLKQAHLRLASNQLSEARELFVAQHYKICSLSGTLGQDGCHLHISIADEAGHMLGGYLQEGCIISTTCELVLGVCEGIAFTREDDVRTGCRELAIRPIL